jgi:hypothetical protein
MANESDGANNSSCDPNIWQPSLAAGVKVKKVENETILLDAENQRVHQLDEVGARILDCCNGRRSVNDIITHMLQKYDVSHDVLAADVTALLGRMKVLKILI